MRVIRDYQFVEENDKGASAAIGNFDGVHLGHIEVLNQAKRLSKKFLRKINGIMKMFVH